MTTVDLGVKIHLTWREKIIADPQKKNHLFYEGGWRFIAIQDSAMFLASLMAPTLQPSGWGFTFVFETEQPGGAINLRGRQPSALIDVVSKIFQKSIKNNAQVLGIYLI
jgi:hypothetical protein